MDASNMLKPALARGELHCMGATTLDEYRKHIEKDAALAALSAGDGLRADSWRTRYPFCAASRRSTSCITACASPTRPSSPRRRLSNRYIADRFLPDKAIDLIDEAGSRLRMEVDSKPEEIDELDAQAGAVRRSRRRPSRRRSDKASKDRFEEAPAAARGPGGKLPRTDAPSGRRRRKSWPEGAKIEGAARPGPQRDGDRPAAKAAWTAPASLSTASCRSWSKSSWPRARLAEEHRVDLAAR